MRSKALIIVVLLFSVCLFTSCNEQSVIDDASVQISTVENKASGDVISSISNDANEYKDNEKVLSYIYQNVPELSRYGEEISKKSNGEACLTLFISNFENGYYVVYVGEDWPDHTVNWDYFYVDEKMTQILYSNMITGDLLTLSEWRDSSQYRE